MRQIIFVTTILLFVSCGQSSEQKTTKTAINTDKESSHKPYVNITSNTHEAEPTGESTAVQVALTFINSYVENCNKANESIGLIEWVNTNGLATDQFKSEVKTIVEKAKKENPEMGLDADPIFDGQDYPDEGFELESFDNQANYIVFKGKKWADFKLTIKVILEDNKWLVDGCGIINIPQNRQNER